LTGMSGILSTIAPGSIKVSSGHDQRR
jgi:hypothetical protein